MFIVSCSRCDGKRLCEMSVNSDIFGDPCPGTHKYMEVHYACSPKFITTTKRPFPPWFLESGAGDLWSPQKQSTTLQETNPTMTSSTSLKTSSSTLVSSSSIASSSSSFSTLAEDHLTTSSPRKPILVTQPTTPVRIPITTPKPTTTSVPTSSPLAETKTSTTSVINEALDGFDGKLCTGNKVPIPYSYLISGEHHFWFLSDLLYTKSEPMARFMGFEETGALLSKTSQRQNTQSSAAEGRFNFIILGRLWSKRPRGREQSKVSESSLPLSLTVHLNKEQIISLGSWEVYNCGINSLKIVGSFLSGMKHMAKAGRPNSKSPVYWRGFFLCLEAQIWFAYSVACDLYTLLRSESVSGTGNVNKWSHSCQELVPLTL